MPLPKYLLDHPVYHGGAEKQFELHGRDEKDATPSGWVARRWDPAVQERLQKLLLALGKQFDGRIEGINFAETAIDLGETRRLYPKNLPRRSRGTPQSPTCGRAKEMGVAMGGPDLQDRNYSIPLPKTGKPVTIPKLIGFANGYLNVKYIFWCTEEPFYSRDLITYLRDSK